VGFLAERERLWRIEVEENAGEDCGHNKVELLLGEDAVGELLGLERDARRNQCRTYILYA
jgi:hypothetical protein